MTACGPGSRPTVSPTLTAAVTNPARQPPITHSATMRHKEDCRLLDNPYVRQIARSFCHVMTAPRPGVIYAAVTAGRLEEAGTAQRERARR
jgi:hypothetical protein